MSDYLWEESQMLRAEELLKEGKYLLAIGKPMVVDSAVLGILEELIEKLEEDPSEECPECGTDH